MARHKDFRILIASDGSLSATAAVVTAKRFPWPEATRAYGVIARERAGRLFGRALRASLARAAKAIAESTTSALFRRWPDVRIRLVEGPPVDAIVRRAKTVRADVIVLGWRGHGAFKRVMAGSVSRGVVRNAPCSVLVVRRAVTNVQNIVIGFDGSRHARHAVAMVARLHAPAGGRVLLLTAPKTMRMPSTAVLRSDVRGAVAAEVTRINRRSLANARAQLDVAAETLRAAGWETRTRVTPFDPLKSLLAAVSETDADLLVVGARGVTGLERLLLGSVAEGALDRSPVPVMIVR